MGSVLLVNPNQVKPAVAPIALDYLAHSLRVAGFSVELLDLCLTTEVEAALDDFFAGSTPDLIGISLRNTDDVYFASQDFFLPRLKGIVEGIKARSDAPLVLGGVGFSVMPEAILEYFELDLGIWGEGEHSLPLLATRIVRGEGYQDVPALIYRQGGFLHRNPPVYITLSRAATPSRDLVDNYRYLVEGGMGNIETKRGCPKECIYCADPVAKGRRLRVRSPQSVAEEVEGLLEKGVDTLHLCDSEFNLPPDHAKEVCREMIKRGLGGRVRWYCYASPTPFDPELADLMARAGCVGIDFGADSGDEGVLRHLGRDFGSRDLVQTARLARERGIVFMYDLLLGGPGETRESLARTIELMKRISPDRVGVSLGVRIFPGTRLAAMVRGQGPLEGNRDLQGVRDQNDDFLAPVFYLSSALGENAEGYLSHLIGGDERFFFGSKEEAERNYNYNENSLLVQAIKDGYRGAFWDILRRVQMESARVAGSD